MNRDSRKVLFVSYILDEFCLSNELDEQYIGLLEQVLRYPLIHEPAQEQYMIASDYRVIKRAGIFEHNSQIINLLADLYQVPITTVKNALAAFLEA